MKPSKRKSDKTDRAEFWRKRIAEWELSRVTQVVRWERSYTYDKVGNRTGITTTEGVNTTTYGYGYNGFGQLVEQNLSATERIIYDYDANGNLTMQRKQEKDPEWTTDHTWNYAWDAEDRLILATKVEGDAGAVLAKVEYRYCPPCGGAMSDRIEYDDDVNGDITSWLRYEYEGLNLLRIDERFDDDDPADGIHATDPWRPLNAYVHAPGQIPPTPLSKGGQGGFVRGTMYRHSDTETTTHDMVYTYDALGNVAGVLVECDYYRFDMDAGSPDNARCRAGS